MYDTKTEITTSRLALEAGVLKSKISYYVAAGLLPVLRIDGMRTLVFDRTVARLRLKDITRMQSRGKTIQEMKELLTAGRP